MLITKRKWIFCLLTLILIMASLAVTDASMAASIKPVTNNTLQNSLPRRARQELLPDNSQNADKLEDGLLTLMEEKSRADLIVRFSAQADLSAAYSMDWTARGEFVYNSLRCYCG